MTTAEQPTDANTTLLREAIQRLASTGNRIDLKTARQVYKRRIARGDTAILSLLGALTATRVSAATAEAEPAAPLAVANSLEDLLDFGESCLPGQLYNPASEEEHDHSVISSSAAAHGEHDPGHGAHDGAPFASRFANQYSREHDSHGDHHETHKSYFGNDHSDHGAAGPHGDHQSASTHAQHGGHRGGHRGEHGGEHASHHANASGEQHHDRHSTTHEDHAGAHENHTEADSHENHSSHGAQSGGHHDHMSHASSAHEGHGAHTDHVSHDEQHADHGPSTIAHTDIGDDNALSAANDTVTHDHQTSHDGHAETNTAHDMTLAMMDFANIDGIAFTPPPDI